MIENLAIKNNLIHRPLSCEAIRMDYSNQLGHINVPIKTLGEILNNVKYYLIEQLLYLANRIAHAYFYCSM